MSAEDRNDQNDRLADVVAAIERGDIDRDALLAALQPKQADDEPTLPFQPGDDETLAVSETTAAVGDNVRYFGDYAWAGSKMHRNLKH